ncbi:ATP-dependent RNA helicase [Acanthamoeba polyphaga mimivirus]|uniref:RNA helicase n=1 Tax=Acanthamoeba polyphaga mimivirus TaxID=212035 RepID=A0A2L2DJC3_MIMIV|nr:ATP-dependent RNA helicase [Acanthamoeba polyphaga mimivirus]
MASTTVSNNIIENIDWSLLIDNGQVWIKKDDDQYRFIKNNLINWIFPVLNVDDKQLLLDSIVSVINTIYLKFGFDDNPEKSDTLLWKQLIQNRLLDLRALLAIMLPFINDNAEDDKKHKLKNLSDLFLQKDERGVYVYTNTQYNRCVRRKSRNDTIIYNRPFMREYFLNHLQMLLMSIESCSNKLYINWVDVLPITMTSYQTTKLYVDTMKKMNNLRGTNNVKMMSTYIDPNSGLSFQDIYNVISNHLFHEIKNHKWLIYDIIINNKPITLIKYLETKFDFEIIWKEQLWSQLSPDEINVFASEWNLFLNSNNITDSTILHHFYFFFSKYHVNSSKLIRQGKLILNQDPDDEIEDMEEDIRVTPETTRYARQGMINVPVDEIYLFLYNQLTAFKQSWYYYMIKTSDREYLDTSSDIFITPKNVYNFSKSMVHYNKTRTEYLTIPKYWNSLKPEFIEMILIRILDIPNNTNNWSKNNWFNINKYLRKIYPNISEEQLPQINYDIYNSIRKNIISIIFESMIYHGLLSDFKPNATITDNSIIESLVNSDDDRKKTNYKYQQIKKQYLSGNKLEDYLNNAYYYITCAPYNELPPVYSPKYSKTDNYSKPYFDFLTSDQIWTFTYAMNWVSQINFYHHYANNRVMYITGATGVGKSTQVPKLLMYSQKMIDYNANGKIICTQPRVPPTVGNAETISRELGVQLRIYSGLYEKNIFSNRYEVQFKHKKEQHLDRNSNSFLRIVTDGTLLEEMVNAPFMTKSRPNNTAIDADGNVAEWVKNFTSENIYDILIIDEAHEHNANMDMILTLARDIVYMNNSIKLVIVSATMDDDEPIYRRYYRNINDNRAYPVSSYIETNILDRANMDRRIHISPPGATTQFIIKDHYLTKAESSIINTSNFVQYGINKTIEIANTTTQGDILLFMTGQADIRKAIRGINSKTSSNVIALGYYSELSEEMKTFIVKIHETLSTYTRYKEDVELEEKDITRRVPPGTYTRAVIIATNVAEASITLTNLKYVIDTGYNKVVVFDPLESISKTLTVPISYSSATQRRGRVGRLASGEVYHMYDEEKIINNKTAYKIADSNVRDLVIKFLKSNPKDSHIVTPENDINSIKNLQKFKQYYTRSNQSNFLYEILKNPNPYMDIIKNRYTYVSDLKNLTQFYTYYGKTDNVKYIGNYFENNLIEYMRNNHDDYDYQMNDEFYSRAYTGYDDYILEDQQLVFYIIHPDENVITRNLYTGKFSSLNFNQSVSDAYYYYLLTANNIRNFNDIKKINYQNFSLLKYHLAINDAKSQLLVVDIPMNQINQSIQYTNIDDNSANLVAEFYSGTISSVYTSTIKSMFFSNINKIQSIYSLDITNNINNLLWYSYGLPYNVQNDILALLLMINVSADINQWIIPSKSKTTTLKFFGINSTFGGDIYFLWKLWNDIKSVLQQYNLAILTEINETLFSNFKNYKMEYLRRKKIPFEQFLLIDNMYKSGKLNVEDEYYYYINDLNMDYSTITTNTNLIEHLTIIAQNRLLNPEKIIDFVIDYLNNSFMISKKTWMFNYELKYKLNDEDNEFDVLEWANRVLLLPSINLNYPYSVWDKIYEAYIRAYSNNLVKNQGNYYLKINNGLIIPPSTWSKNIKIEKTFIKSKTPYLIYHVIDSKSDESNIIYLSPVKLKWVFQINPLYYYYLLYDSDNILDFIKPGTNILETTKIIETNRKYFEIPYLIQYLDTLDDPYISKIIRDKLINYD